MLLLFLHFDIIMWQYHRTFLNKFIEIFHTVFVLKLFVFYNVFELLEDCFIVMLNEQFRQNISKYLFKILLMSFLTFHYSFVQMFHNYFTGCVLGIKPMFCKTICNKQMYNIYIKC